MEDVLTDIINGPFENMWNRIITELPGLVTNSDFVYIVIDQIYSARNHKRLEERLILNGFLPGMDKMDLQYKLENFYRVLDDRRQFFVNSVHKDLSPEVLDELNISARVGETLIFIGDALEDYNLVWYTIQSAGRLVEKYLFSILNENNYSKLLHLDYLYRVGNFEDSSKNHIDRQIIGMFKLARDHGFKYLVKFIQKLKNFTVDQVFDYYMSLTKYDRLMRSDEYTEPYDIYRKFYKAGVSLDHMHEYQQTHVDTELLRSWIESQ